MIRLGNNRLTVGEPMTLPTGLTSLRGLGAPVPDGLSYKVLGAVAKPNNSYTLGVFQGLQRMINVYAAAYGLRQVTVDGDLGPATLTATRQVLGVATVSSGINAAFGPSSILLSQIDSVDKLAQLAASITAALARMRNVPVNNDPNPAKRGSPLDQPLPDGTPAAAPPVMGGGGVNWKLAAGIGAVGLGLLLLSKRRKSRKAA